MKKTILLTIVLTIAACGQDFKYITDGTVIGPYSPAVQAGPFLFVSGQIGIDPATGQLVQDDIAAQTKQLFANMEKVLAQAGCNFENVVQCTVYLKDMKDFPVMNEYYARYFTAGKYPARQTVEVSSLPRNARIEIAVIAVK